MLFHKSKLTYKKVPMVIVYKEEFINPLTNPFNQKGVFIMTISTEFNGQSLYLPRRVPELTPEAYRNSLKYQISLMVSKINQYQTMLQMDKEYKLHEQHPLIIGRLH